MTDVSFDFSDQTVIVTGGSSGIGRGIAERFAHAGARVLVADVRRKPKAPDQNRPTHEKIRDAGGRAEYVETDVSSPDQIATLVEAAREFGGVDVMVNNAGLSSRTSLLDATREEFDELVGVNVGGVLFGCKHAAADMIERDDPGVVLNTASISSNHAQYDHVIYDATKGAIRMITRCAALELAEFDIRVNAVAPGVIATAFTEGGPEKYRRLVADDELIKSVPLGRAGDPDDVASAMLFLASDEADYITGELLHVDAGWQVY